MSFKMPAVLVLWLMFGLLANLPAAFSRPRRLKDRSGVEANELLSAKRQSSSGCRQVVNNTLTSPGYPSNYPNYVDCVNWVPIPAGKAMNIYFNEFDVEHEINCGWDYLEITNENNQTFGKYCGSKSGLNVVVTGHYVVLKFHSDESFTDKGYRLTFSAFSNGTQPPPSTYPTPGNATYPPFTTSPPNGGCGYVQGNQLNSPGWPNYYPNNMDCTYRIHIPHGKALRIYFDVFKVDDCGWDYLRISNEQNQTFGEFCGDKSGHVVHVTGHYAVITFHSDSSINDQGYKLDISDFSNASGNVSTSVPYTTYPPYNYSTSPPWYTTAPPSGGCGSVQGNQLNSPGWPNNYPNNMDCSYAIYIPHGKALRIYFDVFKVDDCGYDYLRITNERNQTFGSFCGDQSGHVVHVTGQYAIITFHSDSSITDQGYKLDITDFSNGNVSTSPPYTTYPPYNYSTGAPWYTTAPPSGGCGYVQNNTLTSPGYPNYYPNNMDCTYWIYIPHGKALRIYFDVFEVDDCGYDYLRITNERNQTFGEFCGSQQGHGVTVTGHYAVITFHSDSSINDRGYKLYISDFSYGNSSTSPPWPYTTYPPYVNSTSYPTPDAKTKLQTYITYLRIIINEMEKVVNNELGSNISVRSYKERVTRVLSDVHAAVNSGSRQKRDVRSTMVIGQLEKKAADLMKKLNAKEAQYKRRALLKKKMAKRAPRKAY